MARLHLLVAATVVVLAQSSPARAEPPPVDGTVAGPPSPGTTPNVALTHEEAGVLPGGIMRVLDALVTVGIAQIDRSSALVSGSAVTSTARLPVRAPTWVSPEPPTKPLLYSRVMQLTF